MTNNSGELVLITGASSGLGEATALYLAAKGYRVIGTSRSAGRLASLENEAAARDISVVGAELDINSDPEVASAIPKLVDEHGPVDVLVNNAGYGLWGPTQAVSMSELKAQFETNFFGAFRMIKAVLPGMVERKRGTIVNVSSVLGRLGTPFNGAYSASKFALEGLSESLRVELWPLGVRVALIEPGYFPTAFRKNQHVAEQAESADLPYGNYIEGYRRRHRRYERQADLEAVARVIHKIVRSRRPRFRYPVGWDAKAGILGARWLPERVFQGLLGRATMRGTPPT